MTEIIRIMKQRELRGPRGWPGRAWGAGAQVEQRRSTGLPACSVTAVGSTSPQPAWSLRCENLHTPDRGPHPEVAQQAGGAVGTEPAGWGGHWDFAEQINRGFECDQATLP